MYCVLLLAENVSRGDKYALRAVKHQLTEHKDDNSTGPFAPLHLDLVPATGSLCVILCIGAKVVVLPGEPNPVMGWVAQHVEGHGALNPLLATPVDLQRQRTLSPGLIISGTMAPGSWSSHFPRQSCVQPLSSSSWSGLWLTTTTVTPREARVRMGTSENYKITHAIRRLVRVGTSSFSPGNIVAVSFVRRSN